MMLEFVIAFVVLLVGSAAYRLLRGLMRGSKGTELMADGVRPTTKSIWRDAAIFAALLVVAVAVVLAAAYKLTRNL